MIIFPAPWRAVAALSLMAGYLMAGPLAAADAPVTLRYTYVPGESVATRVAHRALTETTMNGTTQAVETMTDSTKTWTVVAVDAAGAATLEHAVDDVTMTSRTSDRGEIRWTSTGDDEPPPGYELVPHSLGVPLVRMVVAPDGRVLDVQVTKAGADTLLQLIKNYARSHDIKRAVTVGVIGLGGLGHMGIKFARAMGAKTIMITTSAHKAQDALRLGADGVLLSNDAAAMQAMANQFDFLLNTIPVYHDYNVYLPLLKVDGTQCIVGTIGMNAELNARSLIMGRRSIAGSLVGGIQETQEMLDFCAEHQIVSDIEMIPMNGINQAYERMQQSDVKYRFVIDMSTLA